MVGREASVAHLGRHPTVTVSALMFMVNGFDKFLFVYILVLVFQMFKMIVEH